MKCIVFLLPLVALACGRTTVGSGYGGDYQQWTGSNWMKNLETILGKYQGSEQTQYHDSSVGEQSQEKQRDTTYQSTKVNDSKDSSLLQQVVDSQTPKQQTQQSQYPTGQVVPFTNSWYQKYQQYFGQVPRQEDHFGQWFQQYAHGQYKPVANFWYQKEHQYQTKPYQYNKFGDYQQYESEAPSQQYWYQQYEYPVGQVSPVADSWYQKAYQYQVNPYQYNKYGDSQQYESQTPRQLEWFQKYMYPVGQLSPVADSWYQKAYQYQVNPYQYNKYGDYQQYESQTPRQLEWFQKYMYPVGQVSPVADSWYQKAHQYQVNPYQYNKYGDYQQYQDVPYGSLEFGDDQKVPFEYGTSQQYQGNYGYGVSQQYQGFPYEKQGNSYGLYKTPFMF